MPTRRRRISITSTATLGGATVLSLTEYTLLWRGRRLTSSLLLRRRTSPPLLLWWIVPRGRRRSWPPPVVLIGVLHAIAFFRLSCLELRYLLFASMRLNLNSNFNSMHKICSRIAMIIIPVQRRKPTTFKIGSSLIGPRLLDEPLLCFSCYFASIIDLIDFIDYQAMR